MEYDGVSDYLISIHTPARGVTKAPKVKKESEENFNPHSRKGSDVVGFVNILDVYISIHTPARGVTDREVKRAIKLRISIHTPARGVTELVSTHDSALDISIHTPARGVTP